MKDIIEACMNQCAWQRYQETTADTNYACVETIRYLLPIVIERELTGSQQLCMQLHYLEHRNQTEIARLLGITQPTVSRKLKTARKKVEKYLDYSLMAANKTSSFLH